MASETKSITLSAPYLNALSIRPDQVFSEVSATIASSALNFVSNNGRYEFLQKLQQDSGIVLGGKGSDETCIIKGSFEQILLAKIKLEKCVIDLQMELLSDVYNPSHLSRNGSICWQFSPQNYNKDKILSQLALDGQDQNNASYKVLQSDHNAISSVGTLKSLQELERPSKLTTTDFTSPGEEHVFDTNQINSPTEEVRNSLSDVPSADASDTFNRNCNSMIAKSESREDNPNDEVGTSAPSFTFEEETGLKMDEWFTVNLQQRQQQNAMNVEDRHSEDEMSFEYSCELCSFKAQCEGQFLKHVLIHGKDDTVHICDKCDFASVSLNHYNRHKLSHSDTIFKCPQCPYQTDDVKQLARHITIRHTMIGNPPNSTSILQCNECRYNTTKIYHFERHLLVHNRDLKGLLQVYQCDQCSYKTHRKEHFIRHRDGVHLQHRPYQCNMCSRSYKRRNVLQQHLIAAHNVYPQFS